MASFFIRLKDLFPPELVPANLFSFAPLTSVIDRIGITSYQVETTDNGVHFEADLGFRELEGEEPQVALSLPSFPNLALVFESLGSIDVWFQEDFKVQLSVGTLSIRFPAEFLRPVRAAGNEGWESDPGRQFVEARLSFETIQDDLPLTSRAFPFVLKFERDGGFGIDYPVSETSSLPVRPIIALNGPAMLGDSGFVIEVQDLSLNLDPDDPSVHFDRATLRPPPELASPAFLPVLTIEDAVFNNRGFSGSVSADWPLIYDNENSEFQYRLTTNSSEEIQRAELFDITGGVRHIGVSIDQNLPIAVDMQGSLLVPYFDEPVELKLDIAPNGALSLNLQSEDADGFTLAKEELLELTIRSLTLARSSTGVGSVLISGALEPLLMSSDGLAWPQLDVTDLSIDSTGKFSIKEAWLDLKDLASLDLWGFHFELRRIGIGSEEANDKLWVDLSGGLRLIEQIPVALDVEGFRLTWPRTLLDDVIGPLTLADAQDAVSQIEVQFAGIYLFFGVPDAVEFEGLIRFFKNAQIVGFAGDMALRVPASGFGAEAGLLIGLSFAPPFPFLYVYFGVDLPAGIPLGQSGLALKGAQGMFGLNVAPDRTEDQNWYYDWYKRGPIVGAHPTNKWKPRENALALGVGVTITTADGYVKGTRGLIVLSIPGPVLIIEGRALILSGLQPNAEPPLRALAVFDGGAGTVQFNVEAEATLIADLLKAYGMLEAFFDFNDLTNWHIYLGQDTPGDRRIRADILKLENSFLFKADAYLMMDMVSAETLRSRIGVSIGFEPTVPKIDPLEVDFAATLGGDGVLTARPEQFSGEVDLEAHIKLSAFGLSVRVSADARFLTEGARPLKVGAHVNVKAEMPAPLDPVETTLEFEWEAPEDPRVESPLSEIAVSSRFVPDGGGFKKGATEQGHQILDFSSVQDQWKELSEKSPVVPVDSQPIIGFKQKMNSTIASFARHPTGQSHHYDVGLFYFTPALINIDLYEHLGSNDDWSGDPWKLIASTDPGQHKPLPGVWLAESEPQSPEVPPPKRVQFWTDNPLSTSGRALGSGYTQFRGAIRPGKPLAARLLDDYPDLMECTHTKVESVCVDFKAAGEVIIDPGDSWEYEDLRFEATSRTATVRTEGNNAARATSGTGLLASIADAFLRGASWLVGTLIRRAATDTCLFVDGYIDIHFRRRVKKVRIVLCQPSKLSPTEIRVRVSTKRGIRSISELGNSGGNGRKTITLADVRGCSVNVAADLTVSAQEWLLEADEGFDCLHIVRMDEFAIREICYTTVEEVERSRLAIQECTNNSNLPTDGQTLLPGAYYRLDVKTTVTGELHLEDLPFNPESAIGTMLEDAYNALVVRLTDSDLLDNEFHETCLFQTEAPPTNLRPYVKWCSPEHQSERFFYRDNIAIRLLRSNIKKMFVPPFDLTIQIRDAQGKLIDGYDTSWHQAKSATLFAEERIWQEHRSTLGWPAQPISEDDVLVANILAGSQSNPLQPRSRYQLEVVGSGSGPDHEPVLLFSSTFVTSEFESFKELTSSYSGNAKLIAPKEHYQAALSSVTDIQQSSRALARARWEWEHAEVDYRFELLPNGRKGLEQTRLVKREAGATHDARFRALAESLADLYFQPVSDSLELYLLRDLRLNAVVGAWIRSPESLDLRLDVLADPNNQQSDRIDYVGRTEISLQQQNSRRSVNPIITLHNTDSTQLLIFPGPAQRWRAGRYAFVFTYYRDYGDEIRTVDHRYDRPVEHFGGNTDAQSFELEWSWQ